MNYGASVAQASSLPYRRLPVGVNALGRLRVGNARYGRLEACATTPVYGKRGFTLHDFAEHWTPDFRLTEHENLRCGFCSAAGLPRKPPFIRCGSGGGG